MTTHLFVGRVYSLLVLRASSSHHHPSAAAAQDVCGRHRPGAGSEASGSARTDERREPGEPPGQSRVPVPGGGGQPLLRPLREGVLGHALKSEEEKLDPIELLKFSLETLLSRWAQYGSGKHLLPPLLSHGRGGGRKGDAAGDSLRGKLGLGPCFGM